MLNQLPKNLNQNSFNKEKHINLLDNLPAFSTDQETRIVNFIFFLTLFFSIISFIISYLNFTSYKNTDNLDGIIALSSILDNKREYTEKIKEEVTFLRSYKEAVSSIKTKKHPFFNDIVFLQSSLTNSRIQEISYTQNQDVFNFTLTLLSPSEDISSDLNRLMEQNRRLQNLKIIDIQKLEDNQTEFTLEGETSGR